MIWRLAETGNPNDMRWQARGKLVLAPSKSEIRASERGKCAISDVEVIHRLKNYQLASDSRGLCPKPYCCAHRTPHRLTLRMVDECRRGKRCAGLVSCSGLRAKS